MDHLFFSCGYARKLWKDVLDMLHIRGAFKDFNEFNARILLPRKVVDNIRIEVYNRINNVLPVKTSTRDREWFRSTLA